MRNWSLGQGDTVSLTIAADTRLSHPDYLEDQVWELILHGGEPAALTLQSSLGLRAHWVRFYPRFQIKNTIFCDPAQFHLKPAIQSIYSNFISVLLYPVEGLEVRCDYWIPGSTIVAGRISLHNHNRQRLQLDVEWAEQVNPLNGGETVSAASAAGMPYLKSRFENRISVCLMNGHPRLGSAAGPTLVNHLDLAPGAQHCYSWACGTGKDERAVFDQARAALSARWDAEIARVELLNSSQMVEIITGNENWDAVLALSQKNAFSLFYPGGQHLPHPSFVLIREPDNGFSRRGDGSDFPVSWKGQTSLDAYYLSNIILPGGVDLLKGVLRNFLVSQKPSGMVDWRLSLAGDRSRRMAQPLLAALALAIYSVDNDRTWLAEVYPALVRFIRLWTDPEFDQDGDGYPEWEHPLQTGMEDNPLFDRWHAYARGVNINFLECPSMAAFLYRELCSLTKIARILEKSEDISWLSERQAALRRAIGNSWDEPSALFAYRDAVTHRASSGKRINSFQGIGTFTCREHFPAPNRLQLTFLPMSQATRPITVRIHGQSPHGEIQEDIPSQRWYWQAGKATATSQQLFTVIKKIDITGISTQDTVHLDTVDYTQDDISLFLPLWAGLASVQQSGSMVKRALLTRYAMPFGLPTCPDMQGSPEIPGIGSVSPLWNHFVIEGLLDYGYRDLAADLFSRILDGMVGSLQTHCAFHEFYDAQSGAPVGERNHLRGLAPVGLFLRLLGIKKIARNQVILTDFSPFSWPITVKYHGVEIQSHPTHAVITFPNGQSTSLVGPGPHCVTLEPLPPV